MNNLPPEFRICEVSDGKFIAEHIFARKLGGEPPEHGRHVVALFKHAPTHLVPLGYQHVDKYQGLGLCGGGCVDGRGFHFIGEEHRLAIRAHGGVLHMMLQFVFSRMADDFEAFMTCSGDAYAREILARSGFEATKYQYLMSYFHKHVSEERQHELIEKANSVGLF